MERKLVGYPRKYAPEPIEKQVAILRGFFPELEVGKHVREFERRPPPLITSAEAHFAIIRWSKIASSYSGAFEKILDIFKRASKWGKARRQLIDLSCLRQRKDTIKSLRKLDNQQKGDIFVIPAQFGLRYRKCSFNQTLKMLEPNEFCFGVFQVGCMLLTHPKRLADDYLAVGCPGDEASDNFYKVIRDGLGKLFEESLRQRGIHYNPNKFDGMPEFSSHFKGEIILSILPMDVGCRLWGSATGFIPKY